MAFFQTSVVNKYLNSQDKNIVKQAYENFSEYFHNPDIQKNIRNAKEEQFQEGFLRELFVNIFGYTLNPKPDFNLTTEFKNEQGAKKADGAILHDGKALAVIELKGTNTTDLDKVSAQAFGYKNNQSSCVYIITSNFEKLRFYIDNQVEYIEFNLFTLTEEQFKLLWFCLNKSSLLAGTPEKAKKESIVADENVTKQLYKDYSDFKNSLWLNMIKNSPEADQLLLYKKTQKLLDRFLFIFFSEDSGLLPPNSISRMVERWENLQVEDAYKPLYVIFKQFFSYINTGKKGETSQNDIFAYNGGLFLPDDILDKINIDDEVIHSHVMKLTAYNFESEVNVNILGHIFENSLNEIENVRARLEGREVDKKQTKRKKDGVFYTPKYITKYIVDSTVGKLCEEKKVELGIDESEYAKGSIGRQKRTIKKLYDKLNNYRDWLLTITICDPACGSGAFLNQALEFLIAEHAYTDELEAKLFGNGIKFKYVTDQILENNLFGVDINEESVEIAKLSLWLRTAEKGRKLTSLNNNIKCGNSLIDDPEVAGELAFNWEKEFPDVFAKGGFDVVIGNPPYVQSHTLDEDTKNIIYLKYKTAQYQINTYSIFLEKILNITRPKGNYSVIIPNYWLSTRYDANLRELVFLRNHCFEILNVYNVFADATVDTVILTGERIEELIFPKSTFVRSISNSLNNIDERLAAIDGKILSFNKKVEFNNINSCALISFDEKITLRGDKTLGDYFDFRQGMKPYEKGKGKPTQTREMMNDRIYNSSKKIDDGYKVLLKARNVQRYLLNNDSGYIKYGDNLAAPRNPLIYRGKRILVNRILSKSTIDGVFLEEDDIINNSDIFNLIPKSEETNVRMLCVFVVSKLCAVYFKKENINLNRAAFPKINVNTLEKFPIPIISREHERVLQKQSDIMHVNFKILSNVISKFIKYFMSNLKLEVVNKNLQNWHKLEFSKFITELNKLIKKEGGNKLSKIDEMEWMEVFEAQKSEIKIIQDEIDKTDNEIDQMIYKLYELTDEEIKIIEGI